MGGSTGYCWCVDAKGKKTSKAIRGIANLRCKKVTRCLTTKNVPCVFPFTYKGKKYHKCTTKNYGKKLWCATTAVYKRGKWGRCKPGCKVTGSRCKRLQAKQRKKCGKKVGCFITACNKNGTFKQKQCRGSTGYCWCVDAKGKKTSKAIRGIANLRCKKV